MPTPEINSLNRRRDWDRPSFDELLADEISDPVIHSAHLDRARIRQHLSDIDAYGPWNYQSGPTFEPGATRLQSD